jgi:hypothetical protein
MIWHIRGRRYQGLRGLRSRPAPLGQGIKDGYYPSLFSNSALGSNNPNNLIAIILNGVKRTTAKGQGYMPGFASGAYGLAALTDQEIVLLGNYLLEH